MRGTATPMDVKKEAVKLAQAGHTIAYIARSLRLPYTTIWYWFQHDPLVKEAYRSAEAIVIQAANDHIADVLLDNQPIFHTRRDKIAIEVLKAAERRPPAATASPTQSDVNMIKTAVRDALKDHPEALKAFTNNLKAAKRRSLDDAAKLNR